MQNQKNGTFFVDRRLYVTNNEVSNTLKNSLEKYTISYQLVPPHSHQTDKAERTIQTFKKYFKAGLATLDPYFPIANWDIMLTKQ